MSDFVFGNDDNPNFNHSAIFFSFAFGDGAFFAGPLVFYGEINELSPFSSCNFRFNVFTDLRGMNCSSSELYGETSELYVSKERKAIL